MRIRSGRHFAGLLSDANGLARGVLVASVSGRLTPASGSRVCRSTAPSGSVTTTDTDPAWSASQPRRKTANASRVLFIVVTLRQERRTGPAAEDSGVSQLPVDR